MFERISTGWELAKQSWRALMLDKELLAFPALSGLACLLVLASFAVPLWTSGAAEQLANDQNVEQNPLAYVVAFAFYFCNYFVIIFFNSALVACAIIRFKGGDPTLGDGLRAAGARLPQILAWAAVAATVGLILRIIESRSERFGQIASALLGMAWSAATFFVVPVLVVEGTNPWPAMKRSLAILRKAWGEALTANFGIGLVVFLASLVGIIPLILGFAAINAGAIALGVVAIAAGVVLLLIVSLISSALQAILLGALYLYAAEGTVPDQFDRNLFANAFARK